MTRKALAPVSIAIACAISVSASAAVPAPINGRVRHHPHPANPNAAAFRAAVPERPTVFPSTWPHPYPYNYHETDGLSRNPNDCVVWGCLEGN
jgi:hypothetical protein